MTDKYNVFDFISSPAAIFGSDGKKLYANNSFEKKISAHTAVYQSGADCRSGLFFTNDKGVAKCYLVSADVDDLNNKICIFNDITEFVNRKSMVETIVLQETGQSDYALKKITEKNVRMASLIDSLESGILVEGSSGNLIQVNNSFLEMISAVGIADSPADSLDAAFYHKILSELIDSEDYFGDKADISDRNDEETYTDEIRFKDGRVYIRTYKQLYVGEEARGCMWKFKDVTIRTELENFSSELEGNIRALESSEAVGIYMEYSGYRFANSGLVKMLETDRDSLICNGLDRFIDGELFTDPYKGEIERDITLTNKDGSDVFLNLVSDCLTISGKPAHVVTLKDITEQTHLRRNLEHNENRFRNMFEKNQAIMLIVDPKTMMILNANSSALEFYGTPLERLIGIEMCDLTIFDDMDACMLKLDNMVKDKSGGRIKAHQMVGEGKLRTVELLMTPIGGVGEEVLFVIVDDVHDRVKYEEELKNLNLNLINMVEAEAEKRRRQDELLMEKSRLAEMGEMIGNIAHQWRQPLSALGFLIQDLQDASAYGDLNDEYIQEISRNGMGQIEYMSKTIDDFRDFFRPCTKETVFDVKESVSQVLSIFIPQIRGRGIDVMISCVCPNNTMSVSNTDNFSFCREHDTKIKGYSNQFKQVLLNFLSNSSDAVKDIVQKNISITIKTTEDKIYLSVEDNGGGIPDDIIENIFDPYFTTKSDAGGTGIGLYMSKVIVEDNLGGSLYAENVNDGCRFTIEVDRVVN